MKNFLPGFMKIFISSRAVIVILTVLTKEYQLQQGLKYT